MSASSPVVIEDNYEEGDEGLENLVPTIDVEDSQEVHVEDMGAKVFDEGETRTRRRK